MDDPEVSPCVLTFPVFLPDDATCCEQAFSYLAARLVERDRARLSTLFHQGNVLCNDQLAAPNRRLNTGDELRITLPEHQESDVNTSWALLWSNEELMAVYKPHMLPVSRTTRNLYNTLISVLRRETPYADARLLHRLDTETSGIVLIAKDSAADKKWKPKLDQLITRKLYQAWVNGIPEWDCKVCECLLSEKVGSPIRSQMHVVDPLQPELYPKPKHSKTRFRRLKRDGDRALIECELFTGRKHQIRTHLAELGHPIIGDKIYSNAGAFYLARLEKALTDEDYAILGADHHLLSAVTVVLNIDGHEITINV